MVSALFYGAVSGNGGSVGGERRCNECDEEEFDGHDRYSVKQMLMKG